MNNKVKPGDWPGMIIVMDSIPIKCPNCGHEVSLRGDIDEEAGEFRVSNCPHCGIKMTINIESEDEDSDKQGEIGDRLDAMEISVRVKNLPGLSDCLYCLNRITSVSEAIDRVVNVLATIFSNQDMNPNAIKDLYIRETVASIYTDEGKKSLIAELESQIGKD